MGVHVNSVFSTRINVFDPALYTSITDKEEYLYDVSVLGEVFYQPFVSILNDAIVAWMDDDTHRQAAMQDLIEGIYGSIAMANTFTPVTEYAPHENLIFLMGGWRANIQSQPVDYWDDGIEEVILPTPAPAESPRLEADASTVSAAGNITQETNDLASHTVNARASFTPASRAGLFEDLPQTGNPVMSKQDLGEYIFLTKGYKGVFLELNTPPLSLPSYI